MNRQNDGRRGPVTRNFIGPGRAEAFIVIAIATILITRLYLHLTGYPQIGRGTLHIAHTLYGAALMMLALLIGWLLLGASARRTAVVLGGIGFGLVLDEVGKFVTKTNNYFYGPAAEIMYILVVIVLVGTRALRIVRPLSARECLASATAIAADGVARGLGDEQREVGLMLVQRSLRAGADPEDAEHVHALLQSAHAVPDRFLNVRQWISRLIPAFVKSPRLVLILGWLIVAAAFSSLFFNTLGIALGGYFYQDGVVKVRLGGMKVGTLILMVSAVLTLAMALPATVAFKRTGRIRPVRWLRDAALLFTLLSAVVHFATEGFAALVDLSIGLLAMAVLSYQLSLREQAEVATNDDGAVG
jgi:hypothetical protein